MRPLMLSTPGGKAIWISMLAAVLVLSASTAEASTVNFTLFVDSDGPGTWEVRADSVGDNAGLSLVSVPLVNVDFPVMIETPYIEYFDGSFFQVGMHNFEVDNSSPFGSSQDLATPMPVVYGLGQTAGTLTFSGLFLASRNPSYDASLLLATGTYDTFGPLPTFGSGGSANVFINDSGISVEGATLVFWVVPEPASLALLILGVGVLAGAGKLRRR